MYRTITKLILVVATFFFLGNVFLFAKSDSLKTRQDSTPVSGEKNFETQKSESLAVELLLKDLELPVDHDSANLPPKTHGKTPVLSKTVLKTVPSKKNNSKSISVKNHKPVSFSKPFYTLIPGFAFFKAHAVLLFVLTVSLIALFLSLLFIWLHKDNNRFLTNGRLSIMDKEVQRACDFIEENFANQGLSVELICSQLVTGEAFLNALFTSELGISVENFIDQVRVNRVKIFLSKDLTLDIDKLVLQTGFKGKENMEDIFLAVTGIGFESYRKSLTVQETV